MTSRVVLMLVACMVFVGFATGQTNQSPPAELNLLTLYVPTPEMDNRFGNDIEPLANYIKALVKQTSEILSHENPPSAKGLLIAVGIRSKTNTRVWCQAVDGDVPSKLLKRLEEELAKVEAVDLNKAPAGFAMEIKLFGQKPATYPRFPDTWVEAAKKTETKLLIPPDDLFRVIWPDSSSAQTQSTEFITQVLEPLGGKILRPKDWFYSENHHGPVYMWTLSREDISKNHGYTTGFRIQTFVGVKDGTGKSAKQFILDFSATKKKEAAKVIMTCTEENQVFFTRICLETEEGPYHISYSLFWGNNNLDIAIVTMAGTTKELWATYLPTFEKMSAVELIDMKRFPK
jgi:hypothetical protein